MRFIVDQPGLQQQLRADPSLIPQLLEEVLRLEGSTKMTARLVRKDTHVGDIPVTAGMKVMLATSAANRDPRRWDDPAAFVLDRPKIKEHLGFGRGAHVCPGAPLARSEVRIILEKFLELTSDIDISEEVHGPKGSRTLAYDPSFIIRGLSEMQLTLKPAAGVAVNTKVETKKGGLGALFGLGKKPKEAEPAPTGFSTAHSKIGELLADPAAKAVVDKHFPGVTSDPRIGMGKGVTLRMVQKFAPDMFSDAALNAADADLAKLTKA